MKLTIKYPNLYLFLYPLSVYFSLLFAACLSYAQWATSYGGVGFDEVILLAQTGDREFVEAKGTKSFGGFFLKDKHPGVFRAGDCALKLAQISLSSQAQGILQVLQEVPPPPAPVPPNASLVIAFVLKHSIWPPGSLQNTKHPVPPDQTFYSLKVEVHSVEPESQGLYNFARPGMVIEVFSSDELESDLVGKKIKATLKLAGDTSGVRWLISNIRVFTEEGT